MVVYCYLSLVFKAGSIQGLWRLVIGQRGKSMQTDRGFLILDLNNSTAIAENLGHQRFSEMILDCFQVVVQLSKSTMFEVYQFVGDEAVVSWDLQEGCGGLQAIHFFQDFKSVLRRKAPYFEAKYGILPKFKCGIHGGRVTKANTAERVPRIAYHGDVVNTTARILGKCYAYNTDLLCSAQIVENMGNHTNGVQIEAVGPVWLKGKHNPVPLFKVGKNQTADSLRNYTIKEKNGFILNKSDC